MDPELTDSASEAEDNSEELPPLITSIKSIDQYVVTAQQAANLEKQTLDQAKSLLWHAHRKGRITASLIYKVLSRRDTTPDEKLVAEVLGQREFDGLKVEATRWGITNEKNAIDLFMKSTTHTNMVFRRSGLVVHPNLPYLGPGGGVLTYMFSIGMCRGKDPPFLT